VFRAFFLFFCILSHMYFYNISAAETIWGSLVGSGITVGFLANQYRIAEHMTHAVDFGHTITAPDGSQGIKLYYSPEQRAMAQIDKFGALVGLACMIPLCLTQFGVCNNTLTHGMQFRILPTDATAHDAAFRVIEQGLVSAIVCSDTKKYITERYPDTPFIMRDLISTGAAQLVPRCGVWMGMSAERQIFQTCMLISSRHLANQFRHTRALNVITRELDHATHIVPFIQFLGTLFHKKPSFYTGRSVRIPEFGTDTSQDAYYAAVPTITYFGVGLGVELGLHGFNSTTLGRHVNRAIDRQLHPIFGTEWTNTIEDAAKEGLKFCLFVGALETINSLTK